MNAIDPEELELVVDIMGEHRLEVIDGEGGDWVRLVLDGEVVYENHSIPDDVWSNLMVRLVPGMTVVKATKPDEWFNKNRGGL